ncbi:MAG: hybrid sensor histidine kinase/response regulator, partial [Halofilum sp. (in: g-proteobacteria)]
VDDLRTLREQNGGGADQRRHVTAASQADMTPDAGPAADTAHEEAGDDERTAEPEARERAAGSEPAATVPSGSEQIRVQSDLLDNLVNFAGEVSIYHSRINEQLGQYRFNIQEFDQTVNRLRGQLRDMENETESQIRYSHAVEREQEADAGERDAGFDPLEFDRYTRLHELSRSLSESVGDLDSLKEILDNVTRDAETLLLQQSRVSSELQDGLMQTRMVRFDGLRARLARVVRQTASTVGKKVQMEMTGGELEVDRSIQERIVAPLEHVLRNAVSHGIESPEKRRAQGKPEQGIIRLDLHRGGTDIVIEITDDGGGIDPAAIRRKAIEKGLIDAEDDRDDNEVIKLILETGFSTADEVTQISGRGVGMDVVDAEIRRLGGTLGIQTELGSGTRFTVRLPVTLAINQAVMVQAGDDTYAIPIASIEGVAQVTAGDLKGYYVDRSQPYHYAGNDYRLQHLGTLLGTSEPRLENEEISYPVIMIRAGDDRVALHVDGLVGRREVVVKPLGAPLNMLPGISGATIMADGAVVLILDIGGLLRTEERFIASVGPRLEAVGDAETTGDPDAEEAGDGERTAPTVLVVDDSITIRKVTNRILERNGMTVATAKDGVDALSWMAHTVPDLILLDIEMPRMDGYEVATYVRGDERLADVPIIMITSRTGEKHRQRAEGIGVNRYLGKPYQETELMEHINAVLDERTTADDSG